MDGEKDTHNEMGMSNVTINSTVKLSPVIRKKFIFFSHIRTQHEILRKMLNITLLS